MGGGGVRVDVNQEFNLFNKCKNKVGRGGGGGGGRGGGGGGGGVGGVRVVVNQVLKLL